MGYLDWIITGDGGQAIIDLDGSMRCQLSGFKQMLWNGRDDLTDCEITADIKLYGTAGYNAGGLLLRSDAAGQNCYRANLKYLSTKRRYYIERLINGTITILGEVTSNHPWLSNIKTRFRMDGWQISLEVYLNETWEMVSLVSDTSQAHASGYVGLFGANTYMGTSTVFDNVDIGEKD